MRALGIDIGIRKGLDLVLLDGDRCIEARYAHLSLDALRETVLNLSPDVVAIDSPPRWASLEAMRETERHVRRLGIQLYVTPAFERRSPKGFHDWMLAGMEAFAALEDAYPLFTGGEVRNTAMEVFPHGAAVVLAGGLMPRGEGKRGWRRQVLERQGVDQSALRGPDQVDAALAALAGLYALEGQACWFGKPEEGVIVLPCTANGMPERYLRLAAGS